MFYQVPDNWIFDAGRRFNNIKHNLKKGTLGFRSIATCRHAKDIAS